MYTYSVCSIRVFKIDHYLCALTEVTVRVILSIIAGSPVEDTSCEDSISLS